MIGLRADLILEVSACGANGGLENLPAAARKEVRPSEK